MPKLVRCRFERVLTRRLVGLDAASESLTKHADWTEFHRSREFVAAAWASAFGLRAHGLNRPSDVIKASQSKWISSSISAGSDTMRKSVVWRFRNRWVSVLTEPVGCHAKSKLWA